MTKEPEEKVGGFWSGLYSVITRTTTKNAVTAMHWLVAIVAFVFVVSMVNPDAKDVRGYLLLIFLGTVIADAFAYYWFMIRDPDRLQTEDYRTENKRIDVQLLGDERHKDDLRVITAEPVANTHVTLIGGATALPQLEETKLIVPPTDVGGDGNAERAKE
jgi:hypothetical protein